ncbi:uncharacterized protein LOC116848442 [Odontomachus brunneus]|uniref:uncharacterized protein LOC116848442 n=1 Tax=Odontomachus brunneus TaxID=486640 RepID=UPI0013F1BBCA|nr:uncharacterized protein LOC116848442 [Odontomachus brunneus]
MVLRWRLQFYLLRYTLLFVVVRTEEVFNTTPPTIRTNFSCLNRLMGFYADVEANCKVYHTCDDHGNKFSYRCPEETAFRQDALICDHAHLVDCQATVYPPNRFPDENTGNKDKEALPLRSPATSIDSPDDHRLSFSRSFQVVQRPDKSVSNKHQSGFVFSASLFLRDHDRTRDRAGPRAADASRRCNVDSKDRFATASTVRTLTERFNSWDVRNDKSSRGRLPQSLSLSESRDFARDKSGTMNLRRSFEPTPNPSTPARTMPPDSVARRPAFLREKSTFLAHDHNYRPYSETLKSIQANAVRVTADKSTTEIPVHALTLSLKPLVPNELEYDPYYPKQPTSTEAYYTPSNRNGFNVNARILTSSQVPPVAISQLNLPFEIPPVLPDLSNLEDLVDRRKLFYIPRVSAKSIQ